jgi:trimeric autotransporter adhesin
MTITEMDTPVLADQVVQTDLWATNGTVNALAIAGGIIYLGGNFTQVGPAIGCAVAIDPSTGAALHPYPLVNGHVYAFA